MKKSEATLQAEFYHHCRLIGLPIELELSTPVGRLDCAIFSEDRQTLLCIVECKKPDRICPMSESNQIRRYKTLGVPVYGLWKWERAAILAAKIKAANHPGKPIAEVMLTPKPIRRRNPYRVRINGRRLILDSDLNIKAPVQW